MNNEIENKDWINEYPALKQVNPANAFVVPANYFYEMEGRVMDNIRLLKLLQNHPNGGFATPVNYFNQLEQNTQSRAIIDNVIGQGRGFIIPEDYFDNLSQNIESRIAIDGLVNSERGFAVPEGYFDNLSQNIESRIAIDELVNAGQGFSVPEGYFDNLAQNIESSIAVDELLNTEEGFAIPLNYFEGLESRILNKTVNAKATPVKKDRNVVRKLWANKAFKYASAACFTLFIGAAVVISEFNNSAVHSRAYLHKELLKVPESDIESYLQLNADAPTIMENTPDPNSLSKDMDLGELN